jgi:hypothetical protein
VNKGGKRRKEGEKGRGGEGEKGREGGSYGVSRNFEGFCLGSSGGSSKPLKPGVYLGRQRSLKSLKDTVFCEVT